MQNSHDFIVPYDLNCHVLVTPCSISGSDYIGKHSLTSVTIYHITSIHHFSNTNAVIALSVVPVVCKTGVFRTTVKFVHCAWALESHALSISCCRTVKCSLYTSTQHSLYKTYFEEKEGKFQTNSRIVDTNMTSKCKCTSPWISERNALYRNQVSY